MLSTNNVTFFAYLEMTIAWYNSCYGNMLPKHLNPQAYTPASSTIMFLGLNLYNELPLIYASTSLNSCQTYIIFF